MRYAIVIEDAGDNYSAYVPDFPGLHLHRLKGKYRGRWSVRVSGNWRVTFKFDGTEVTDVGYEDYH